MKLPNGVTGFFDKNETPLSIDGMQFKQLCYLLMNSNEGSFLSFTEPQFTNFFIAKVNFLNKKVHILLNAHHPFLAFASDVQFNHIEYMDEPKLYSLFFPYYRVLTTSELNAPFSLKENTFSKAEIKQIAYWKPVRIGEIIFNFWD